jgi:ribosomal protein S18 acetylase RimI-like enzyme
MSGGYRIELLADQDRKTFTSGSDSLDRYFREGVTQDVRRRVANCFVAVDPDGDVAGFYTLAATSLLLDGLAPERRRKLPRYPLVPAILLGRLAVASAHQGRRLGGALVADALIRSSASDIAAHFMVVDAKDEAAARFYEHLEFMRLGEDGRRLVRVL